MFWCYALLGAACVVGALVATGLAIHALVVGQVRDALMAVPAITILWLIAFASSLRASEEF